MADAINQNITTKQWEFGYLEGTSEAWHRLGGSVPAICATSAAEFSRHVGSDYDVCCTPFRYAGKGAVATCDKAICDGQIVSRCNTDQYLSTVGNAWEPHQNKQSIPLLQTLLDTGMATMETSGVLNGGQTTFWCLKFRGCSGEVRTGDTINSYFIHCNQHRYGAVLNMMTTVRTVCANTLALGETKATKKLRVRHTSKVEANVATAFEIIDLAAQDFAADLIQWRKLADMGFNVSDVRRYITKLFLTDKDAEKGEISTKKANMIDRMVLLASSGKGNKGSTLWDAFNGVTEYLTHESGRTMASRNDSLMFGANAKLLKEAYRLAMEMVA